MHERRQHNRYTTSQSLELVERHSGKRLGRLVDLSQDGFMLFSESPMTADAVIECSLLLNPSTACADTIDFVADCLWSRLSEDSLHCWAGFHIIDIDDAQSRRLNSLLQDL